MRGRRWIPTRTCERSVLSRGSEPYHFRRWSRNLLQGSGAGGWADARARAPNERETSCQMESRVRGPASSVARRDSPQPVAAAGVLIRMDTASWAAAGSRDPAKEVSRRAVVECGRVQQRLQGRAGRGLPEPAAVDAARGQSGSGGESGCADHRRELVFATANRRPPQSRRHAGRQLLRIQDRDRVHPLPCAPLPERDGPMARIESSTLAQTAVLPDRPI